MEGGDSGPGGLSGTVVFFGWSLEKTIVAVQLGRNVKLFIDLKDGAAGREPGRGA